MAVWTDGLAINNGSENCVAGASWVSDSGVFTYTRIVGIVPSNNMAETTVVAVALLAWHSADLHIYTDSKFVLNLFSGGLLAMEQDGWPDLPDMNFQKPASLHPLMQFLLFLIRRHNSHLQVSWVKGYSGVEGNESADVLTRKGVDYDHFTFEVSALIVPHGWVDSTPVLNHQSLAHLTYLIVWDVMPNPLLSQRFLPFCLDWTAWIEEFFHVNLDILKHFQSLWTMQIPSGLHELLWKIASNSLPLGHRWHGASDLGWECHCGTVLLASHIWDGCAYYTLTPLRELLLCHLSTLCPGHHQVLDFDEWPSPYWYPLLALKPLEKSLSLTRCVAWVYKESQNAREWVIGTYLWYIWKNHMQETADQDYIFIPHKHVQALAPKMGVVASDHDVTRPSLDATSVTVTHSQCVHPLMPPHVTHTDDGPQMDTLSNSPVVPCVHGVEYTTMPQMDNTPPLESLPRSLHITDLPPAMNASGQALPSRIVLRSPPMPDWGSCIPDDAALELMSDRALQLLLSIVSGWAGPEEQPIPGL